MDDTIQTPAYIQTWNAVDQEDADLGAVMQASAMPVKSYGEIFAVLDSAKNLATQGAGMLVSFQSAKDALAQSQNQRAIAQANSDASVAIARAQAQAAIANAEGRATVARTTAGINTYDVLMLALAAAGVYYASKG